MNDGFRFDSFNRMFLIVPFHGYIVGKSLVIAVTA